MGRGELCDYLGVACITTWLRVFSPMRIRAVRKKRRKNAIGWFADLHTLFSPFSPAFYVHKSLTSVG